MSGPGLAAQGNFLRPWCFAHAPVDRRPWTAGNRRLLNKPLPPSLSSRRDKILHSPSARESMATPSSKRRSCNACVKAKRKCAMELPRCARCVNKDIVCAYPNKTITADTCIPELDFSWLDDLLRDPTALPWEGALRPQLDTLSATYSASRASDDQVLPHLQPLADRTTLTPAETEAAVHRFKTWPEKWLQEGKTPFIHPRLYSTDMPKALQDAYAACAIYSTKTDQNSFVAWTVIESKATDLLRSPDQDSWTPLNLLAAVQALLIFQFIRLYDGDIRQRTSSLHPLS